MSHDERAALVVTHEYAPTRAGTRPALPRRGQWLDSDVTEATKPGPVLDPTDRDDGTTAVEYDFVLEPA